MEIYHGGHCGIYCTDDTACFLCCTIFYFFNQCKGYTFTEIDFPTFIQMHIKTTLNALLPLSVFHFHCPLFCNCCNDNIIIIGT